MLCLMAPVDAPPPLSWASLYSGLMGSIYNINPQQKVQFQMDVEFPTAVASPVIWRKLPVKTMQEENR